MKDKELEKMMRRFFIIPVGLPGSGKSSLYDIACEIDGFFPLCSAGPDEVREREYPGYEEGLIYHGDMNNVQVLLTAEREAEDNLLYGDNVYFDATNIFNQNRTVLYHKVQAIQHTFYYNCNLHYVLIYFDIPLEIVTERNKYRGDYRTPPMDTMEYWDELLRGDLDMIRACPDNMRIHFPEVDVDPQKVHAWIFNWDEGIGWVPEELCNSCWCSKICSELVDTHNEK